MYANLLSEMRRLLNVTKEELSQKSGITVEAQDLIDKYNIGYIPPEVGIPILKALDLPEEFQEDEDLDEEALKEYLVDNGRIGKEYRNPLDAPAKKYEEFNREEQESIQYLMDTYGDSIEEAMFEVQYHHYIRPYSFNDLVERFGVKVFNETE